MRSLLTAIFVATMLISGSSMAGDYVSEIRVYYPSGEPNRGARVSLGFFGMMSGTSKSFYTDKNGIAFVEHSARGKAEIYVNGNSKGTFQSPGKAVVTAK